MLHVYYTELPDGVRFDESRIPLSAYRRERLQKTAKLSVRAQMLAAELLLIDAVRELYPDAVLPLEIETGENGKPFFKALPLAFSLSHSGPFAACAVADREIGLDIQKRTAVNDVLMRRCYSENEQRFVRESLDPDAAFTELWCLKESYLKARGEGIARVMSGCLLKLEEPFTLVGEDSGRFWHFCDTRFCLAVCSLDGKEPIPDKIVKKELRF